jgi:predicted transcriptional regulator
MINNANDLLTTVKMVKQSKKITNLELSTLSGVPLGTVNKILCGQTKNYPADS